VITGLVLGAQLAVEPGNGVVEGGTALTGMVVHISEAIPGLAGKAVYQILVMFGHEVDAEMSGTSESWPGLRRPRQAEAD
jgi:hypothetical protein